MKNNDASERLTALLDAAVDAMIIIDHRGIIELFNTAAERIFGYLSDEVVGQNISMLMPSPYRQEHDSYLHNFMQTNQPRIIGIGREVKALKKDGEVIPIDLSVGEVKNSSHRQFVGIIRDISEQVQARKDTIEIRERLAHVSRLNTMGEMAAGIAHEVNQPLTAVAVYAQACSRMITNCKPEEAHLLNDKLLNSLEKINAQALRAGDVIMRLRGYVKKHTASRELTDINQLVKDTINLAQIDTRLLDHGITLELTDNPPQLMIDAVQIQQVLFNLIRNAIDSMQDKPNEAITIRSRWTEKKLIEVSVVDTGTGVDEENRATLFNPFFTTKESGMGMGLAISQSIIQSHGGHLWYQNNHSNGSIFLFTLPSNNDLAITNDGQ
ncbi:PAS domain S-box protein [Alteromonadaceae bacterium BrNp21-10]|nr:PAS domain S-box protein [Alteromonadaceae bacterium BrNp21-10]